MRVIMVLVTAVLALTTGPAYAGRQVITDPRHDVWTEGGGVMPDMVRSDEVVNVDVARVRVVHGSRAVVIRAKYVDLRRRHFGLTLRLEAELLTNDGRTVLAKVVSAPGHPRGRHVLNATRYSVEDPIACPRMRHRIDYARDVIRIVVPRGCLGRPEWIRARVEADKVSPVVPWIDPVGTSGPGFPTWTRRLHVPA